MVQCKNKVSKCRGFKTLSRYQFCDFMRKATIFRDLVRAM